MTTGSAQSLPWTLVVLIPSTTPGRFSLSRRTLYRALAVVVALAAITPLFADVDSPRGNPQLEGADPQTD